MIGEFNSSDAKDHFDDTAHKFQENLANWMKEYTQGTAQYPDAVTVEQEHNFEIILQGAKVANLMRETLAAWVELMNMTDDDE